MSELIPSHELFLRILAAVKNRCSLSVVRMSDGADGMLTYCKHHSSLEIAWVYDEGWRKRFGVDGITCGEIKKRLDRAYNECTYFAPDGNVDFMRRHYAEKKERAHIVYPAHFTHAQRRELFNTARHVMLINRNPEVGSAMRLACPDIEFTQLSLNDWRASETVRVQAESVDAPLVLLSGGEASRYLAPALAQNRVVLDVGTHADAWLYPDVTKGQK